MRFAAVVRSGDDVRQACQSDNNDKCTSKSKSRRPPGGNVGAIAREAPDRRVEAVVSVILDRVIGLTGLMVLGGVACAVNWAFASTWLFW